MTKLKFDNSNYQLIRNNKVVARAPTLKDLKVIVKNDLPLPPTPVKVFIIKTRDTKKTKMPIEVKCQRYTVTPTGVLVQRANDNSKIFTYTSDELSSAESNSRDLKSMMLHVENNLTPVNKTISYSAMLKDISKMSYNQPVIENPVVEEPIPESVESKIHTPPSFDGPEFQLVKNGNVIATSDSYPKLLDIVHYQLRHPIKHAAQVYLVRVNKSPYLIGDNSKAEVKIERFHIQPDGEFTLDRGYKFPKISYSSSDEVRKNKHLTDIFNEAQKDKYTKNLKQSDEIIPVTKFLTDNSIAFEPVSEVKPEPKLFKIKDEEIKKLVDDKQYLLFVNNKEVLSAESLKSLKEKLKEEFDNPDKDIKGYIVKAGLSKEQGKPLTVNCSQYTITTNLNIVGRSREGDTTQTFTFSDKELKDNGFNLSHIKKMIKVIKNDLISFDGTRIPITDVLGAVKNAPDQIEEPKPSQVIQPVPVAEVKPVDKLESETFLDKEFEKIKKLVDVKNNILFVDNKPILSSPSLQELKQKLKKEFNNPKENIKANIISFKLDKNNKFPVMVNSSQFTITPRLQLFSKDDDNSQTFTYTEKELKDKGFNLEQLTKIQKVIKDNLVSFGERTVPITDVFDAVKNAPVEEPKPVAEVKPVDKPTKYTPTKHIPESESFLDKEFENIKKLVDVKQYNLFVNNKLVLTAPSLPKLKEKLKEEFENPKKDIKANIMSFTLDKNNKFPVMINSSQYTITPQLRFFHRTSDNSKTITYTEKELKDKGFNIEQLTKIQKALKDGLIDLSQRTVPITDVLEDVENAPESPLEEPKPVDKPSQVIQPVPEEIKVLEKDFRHDIISNSQKDSSIGKPPTFDYKNFQLIKNGVVIAKASDMKKLKEIVKKNTKPSLDTFSNVVLMKPEYNIEDSNHPIFVKCKQLTITPLGNLMEVETHNKEQTFTYSDEELDFLGLNDSQLQDMVNTLENSDFDSKETPVSSLKEDNKEEIPPVIPPKLKPVSNKRK